MLMLLVISEKKLEVSMLLSFFGIQRISFHGAHLEFCKLYAQAERTWPINCSYFVVFLPGYQFLQCWNYVCHSWFFIGLLHFFPELLEFNRIVLIHSLYFDTCSCTFNDAFLKKGAHFLENHWRKPGHKLSQTLFRLSSFIWKSSILVESTSPSSFTPP